MELNIKRQTPSSVRKRELVVAKSYVRGNLLLFFTDSTDVKIDITTLQSC